MRLSRLLVLAAFTVMFTGWLQADVLIDPSHFQITLNNDGSFDPNGTGNWGAGTVFTAIPNVSAPDGGFPSGDLFCEASDGLQCSPPIDPFVGTRLGGASETITGEFTFTANADGGGSFDFHNGLMNEEGQFIAITSLELIASLPISSLPEIFSCFGGDAFGQCGFIVTDPPQEMITVETFFSDGHIAPAPEPSTWILLGTAAFALVGRKALRRS